MRLIPALVAASAVLLLGACGETDVDVAKLEEDIATGVKEQSDVDVEVTCPDQVEARKGTSIECEVTDPEGVTKTATVTMLDDDGKVDWRVD
jgi:hypothetical protein